MCFEVIFPSLLQKLSLSVKTDGSLSLEENMRQNLLACYTELVDILKQMAVTHVSEHTRGQSAVVAAATEVGLGACRWTRTACMLL